MVEPAPQTQSQPRGPRRGIYVALGSNLGDRERHIREALEELDQHAEIRVLRVSSLHETEPAGGPPGQSLFLNGVAELETSLAPRELLAWLHEIERRHGRMRVQRWGPRPLDLDLLLYGDEVIDEAGLTVPHPRMWERPFVMAPLAEVCENCDALAERLGINRGNPTPAEPIP